MPWDPERGAYDPEHAAELEEGKKWRAAVRDMNRQVERVIEIGDLELVQYASAAVLDCILEHQQGTLHLRDASRETGINLTSNSSVIKMR